MVEKKKRSGSVYLCKAKWYFDELVTVNSNAALDVKVVSKKCTMSI